MDEVRIVEIIPAPGWQAVFGNGDGGDEFSSPLVCWALVEGTTGERQVVGIGTDTKGTVEIAAYANNFRRYEFRT